LKPIIETNRLIIRKITQEDTEGIFELDSDPQVHRYLGNRPVVTRQESAAQIKSFLKQYKENGIARWAVVEKSSGDFIGWTGFKFIRELINYHENYYDLGYRLIRRYWGKGYASEAASASLDYGFENLDVEVIYAMADLNNKTSLKILQNLGLKCLGPFDYKGVPHEWLSIRKEDWQAKKLV
jgi:[ribosomal protein S5]-alanine N-acetyltransferase